MPQHSLTKSMHDILRSKVALYLHCNAIATILIYDVENLKRSTVLSAVENEVPRPHVIWIQCSLPDSC